MINGGIKSRKKIFSLLFLDTTLRSQAFSVAQKYYSDKEELEKLYLDGLIQLISSIQKNKFGYKSSLTTFFIGICRNLCLRQLSEKSKDNSNKQKYFKSKIEADNDSDSVEYEYIKLEEKRYKAELKRKIYRQLSEKCRLYLRQKYGKKMTIYQMANANDITNQSVRNLGHRCEKRIRFLVCDDPEIMACIKANYGKL